MEQLYRENIGIAVDDRADQVVFNIEQRVAQNDYWLSFDPTPHRVAVAELLLSDLFPIQPCIDIRMRAHFKVIGLMLV